VNQYRQRIKNIGGLLFLLYFLYFFTRTVFFIANRSHFPDVGAGRFIADVLYGLRFDTFSIIVSNGLFILIFILPFPFTIKGILKTILKSYFLIVNSLFLLVNCIDIGYFAFIHKRSSADLLNQAGGQTDLGKLLPQYLADFWWVLGIYLILIYFLIRGVNSCFQKQSDPLPMQKKDKVWVAIVFVFFIGSMILGIRGGFQRNPLDIVDAGGMTKAEEVPIVLNTPFTIIKTLGGEKVEEFHFFSEEELKIKFDPIHEYKDSTFKKMNVVVLILESFAKEYTSLGKVKSYTPFFDSLMQHGLTFTNAYANGAKSIEGIPAILSSMPSLMENPIINSAFSNNIQTSFASVLNSEGYNTSFFHGGINGTMNFDIYAKLAGYQNYFGMNEYNDEKDFDGFWGIWDEPYLQYTVKKMNEFKEPFHSSIFTLSSHHPYNVPKKYEGRFPKGHLENLESVGYSDHCLRLFFESAKKTNWYKNTLFVLVADHCCLSEHPFFRNTIGLKSIPIVFYKGDNSLEATNNTGISQIDILPSVLHLMGYNKKFFSLGQSYSDRKSNCCYYYENGFKYAVCDSILMSYRGMDLTTAYNFKRDSTLKHGSAKLYPDLEKKIDDNFKAFMQIYHATLLHNSAKAQ
jgi:phosphoglycerol transferase MdoB-like AlkP superfamily enzyme